MRDYRVTWEFLVQADNEEEAKEEAVRVVQDGHPPDFEWAEDEGPAEEEEGVAD